MIKEGLVLPNNLSAKNYFDLTRSHLIIGDLDQKDEITPVVTCDNDCQELFELSLAIWEDTFNYELFMEMLKNPSTLSPIKIKETRLAGNLLRSGFRLFNNDHEIPVGFGWVKDIIEKKEGTLDELTPGLEAVRNHLEQTKIQTEIDSYQPATRISYEDNIIKICQEANDLLKKPSMMLSELHMIRKITLRDLLHLYQLEAIRHKSLFHVYSYQKIRQVYDVLDCFRQQEKQKGATENSLVELPPNIRDSVSSLLNLTLIK
jgi:hypothetical protein